MIEATARETIFALSSGSPPAAIAIVRVSGPGAATALQTLCGRLPAERQATVMAVHTAESALIDRALILWFRGPATATGEDLAELHLHGGRAVVMATLAALGKIDGCRAAQAGEFTRRAFDNGRIDLLQAEGLADLLAAETEGARIRALRLAEGGLSRRVGAWRERVLMLGARVEAVLEFGGDDPDIAPDPRLPLDIATLATELHESLASPPAERLRDGVRVLIAGPPNSGKSTLLNALVGRDVVIATPMPGTTRDLVEAPISLGGVAMVLIDSAGLRETEDAIEREGIARTRSAMAGADIILWLGDAGDIPRETEVIVVRSKIDLGGTALVPEEGGIAVSALKGDGIAALQHLVIERIRTMLPATQDASLTSGQRAHVETAAVHLDHAANEADEVLIADDLRAAGAALDQLTGRYAVEAMLETLFGRFCVGK